LRLRRFRRTRLELLLKTRLRRSQHRFHVRNVDCSQRSCGVDIAGVSTWRNSTAAVIKDERAHASPLGGALAQRVYQPHMPFFV